MTAAADAEALSPWPRRLLDVDFTEFFRAEHRKLIRFVMTLGVDSDQAAEIAQVTFFKALQAWGTIRSPRAWIRRVAVNELAAAGSGVYICAECIGLCHEILADT